MGRVGTGYFGRHLAIQGLSLETDVHLLREDGAQNLLPGMDLRGPGRACRESTIDGLGREPTIDGLGRGKGGAKETEEASSKR